MSTTRLPDSGDVASTLEDHPRLLGALFMMVLLLGSTGTAAAGFAANSGP